jgi:branched-subunit amino acid aminotransferase/4-amino-4-deoxychorismate lyase
MLGIASIDGVISPLHEARISVLDRAFQFGDAVFEALRTYGKQGDALEQHVTRLEQSCARLHITLGISQRSSARSTRCPPKRATCAS